MGANDGRGDTASSFRTAAQISVEAVAVVLAALIALLGPWVKPKDPVPKPAPLPNPTSTPVVTEIKDRTNRLFVAICLMSGVIRPGL